MSGLTTSTTTTTTTTTAHHKQLTSNLFMHDPFVELLTKSVTELNDNYNNHNNRDDHNNNDNNNEVRDETNSDQKNEGLVQQVMSHFVTCIDSLSFRHRNVADIDITRDDMTITVGAVLPWFNLSTRPGMTISIQDSRARSILYDSAALSAADQTSATATTLDSAATQTSATTKTTSAAVATKPHHLLGIFEAKHSNQSLHSSFNKCKFKSIPSPRFLYTMIYGIGDKDEFEFGLYSPLYDNSEDIYPNRKGVIHRFACGTKDEQFVMKMLHYCGLLVAFMTNIYQSQGLYTVVHNFGSFLSRFPEWDDEFMNKSGHSNDIQIKIKATLQKMHIAAAVTNDTAAYTAATAGAAINDVNSSPETPPQTGDQTHNPEGYHNPERQTQQLLCELIKGYIKYVGEVLIHIKPSHLFKRAAGQSQLSLQHIQFYQQFLQQLTPDQKAKIETVEAVLHVGHYLEADLEEEGTQTDNIKMHKEEYRAQQPLHHVYDTTTTSTTQLSIPQLYITNQNPCQSKNGVISTIITLQGDIFPSLTLKNFQFDLLNAKHTALFSTFFSQQAPILSFLQAQGFRLCDIRPANIVVQVVDRNDTPIKLALTWIGNSNKVDTTEILAKVLKDEWKLKLHFVDTEYITYCSSTPTFNTLSLTQTAQSTPPTHITPQISKLFNCSYFKPLMEPFNGHLTRKLLNLRLAPSQEDSLLKVAINNLRTELTMLQFSGMSAYLTSSSKLATDLVSKSDSRSQRASTDAQTSSHLQDALLASKNCNWLRLMDWWCLFNSYNTQLPTNSFSEQLYQLITLIFDSPDDIQAHATSFKDFVTYAADSTRFLSSL